jgi:hypothetical protein
MSKKTQLIILAGLAVILCAVAYFVFLRPSSRPAVAATMEAYQPLGVENSEIHWWRMEEARKTDYTKGLRNIFTGYQPPPTPVKPNGPGSPGIPAVPPPPPPVVLPVKYFGYSSVPGSGERRAFFTNGEDVYIVGEGEVLLGQYRVLHIGNTTLDFEEISSKRRGSTALETEAPST